MLADTVVGVAISFVLVLVAVAAIAVSWRAPFRGLGILVAGMALHNILLMVLVHLETPRLVIRGVQVWKEVLVAVLLLAVLAKLRAGCRRPRLMTADWLAIGFSCLVVLYAVAAVTLADSQASPAQLFVSLRLGLLMPLLYLFGRVFLPASRGDLSFSLGLILASAAVVGLFGLWELWLVPTRDWVDWGAVGFSRWLGFEYRGPDGLPANFFHTTGSGLLLRRMVSTYLSPLGVAYTGALVLPLAAMHALSPRAVAPNWPRWARWLVLAVLVAGIGFAMTRLALVTAVAESILLAIILRTRLAILVATAVLAFAAWALVVYPSFGPLMDSSLNELPSPTSFLRLPEAGGNGAPGPSEPTEPESVLSGNDPSIRAHIGAVTYGVEYVVTHPLGTGPGTAVPRYGAMEGPSESALLRIGGEFGLASALLYAGLYVAAGWAGFVVAQRDRGWRRAVGLAAFIGALGLLPISLTSDVWGNFSVTFLFWWFAGLAVTLAANPEAGPVIPGEA